MSSSQIKEQSSKNNYYAIISGLCASSASFFGKLSGNIPEDSNFQVDISDYASFVIKKINKIKMNSLNILFQNIWIIRGICFILMILCNILVWSFFVKALHSTGGTIVATVTSAASNYIISVGILHYISNFWHFFEILKLIKHFLQFVLGVLIFDEKITLNSVIGLSFILIGLTFISKNDTTKNENKTK